MKLNTVISGSLVLTVALLCSVDVSARGNSQTGNNYSNNELVQRSDGFDRSDSFADLDNYSELQGRYENYADIQLLGTTSNGEVVVVQTGLGLGINKAKVVLDDSVRGYVYVGQVGDDNTALVEQSGLGNTAMMYQEGYGHEGYISQDGDNNTAMLVQLYKNRASSSISIGQVNNNNQAFIVDYGGSNYSVEQSGNASIAVRSSMARNITIKQ